MRWENFKSRLKKDAESEEVEVDVDAIWGAIEPEVNRLNKKRKKKKRFFFWIFFTGLLSLSGMVYLLSKAANDEMLDLKKQTKHAPTTDTSNSQSQNTAKEIKKKLTSPKGESSHKEIVTKVIDTEIIDQAITPQPVRSYPDHTAKALTPRTTTKITTKTTTRLPRPNRSKPNLSSQAKLEPLKNQTTPSLTNLSKTTKGKLDNNLKLQERIDQKNFSTSASAKGTKTFSLQGLKTDFDDYPLAQQNAQAPMLQMNNAQPWERQARVEKEGKKFQFSVGASGGVSFVKRELSAKKTLNEEKLITRNRHEKSLEALHLGLQFELQHHTGWRLGLGLQSTRITDLYALKDSQTTERLIDGIETLKVNLYGDTTAVMGSINQTTTTIINKEIYNTYQLLDLPIILGYERSFGPWQAGVELGVLLNLSLRTKGIIPDENYQDIDIGQLQSEYFKSTVGLSYHFGLSLRRKLNEHLTMHFTPMLRYFPQDFSTDNNDIQQKYLLMGAQLGLRYRF